MRSPLLDSASRPALASLLTLSLALGCSRGEPPGSEPASSASPPQAGSPTLPRELAAGSAKPAAPAPAAPAASAASAATPAPEAPYTGPWFAVTAGAAGV